MRTLFLVMGVVWFTGCAPSPNVTEKKLDDAIARADAAEKRLAALEAKTTPTAAAEAKEPAKAAPVAAEPAPAAKPLALPRGTAVTVRTTSLLSTKQARVNDTFVAHLTAPLVAGGVVVAPRGAAVTGRVSQSDTGGRVKGKASITVTLASVTGADGREHRLATTAYGQVARAGTKQDAIKVGVGSGIGAAIGAIAGGGKGAAIGAGAGAGGGAGAVLATRGPAAEIAPESVLRFTLVQPLVLR